MNRYKNVLAATNPLLLIVFAAAVLVAVGGASVLLLYGIYSWLRNEWRPNTQTNRQVDTGVNTGVPYGWASLDLPPRPGPHVSTMLDAETPCNQCGVTLPGLVCPVCSAEKPQNDHVVQTDIRIDTGVNTAVPVDVKPVRSKTSKTRQKASLCHQKAKADVKVSKPPHRRKKKTT